MVSIVTSKKHQTNSNNFHYFTCSFHKEHLKKHLIQNYMTEKIQNLLQYGCQHWLKTATSNSIYHTDHTSVPHNCLAAQTKDGCCHQQLRLQNSCVAATSTNQESVEHDNSLSITTPLNWTVIFRGDVLCANQLMLLKTLAAVHNIWGISWMLKHSNDCDWFLSSEHFNAVLFCPWLDPACLYLLTNI